MKLRPILVTALAFTSLAITACGDSSSDGPDTGMGSGGDGDAPGGDGDAPGGDGDAPGGDGDVPGGDGDVPGAVDPMPVLYNTDLLQDDPRFDEFPTSLSVVETNMPLTVRVEAEGAGAVRFEYMGLEFIDSEAPFFLSDTGEPADVAFGVGTHAITFTSLDNATSRNVLGTSTVSLEITDAGTDPTPSAGAHETLEFWITGSGEYVTQDADGSFVNLTGEVVLAASDVEIQEAITSEGKYVTTAAGAETIEFAFQLLLPEGYDSTVKYPLVTLLHHGWNIFRGTDNDGEIQQYAPMTSGTRSLTDTDVRHDFPALVLLPQHIGHEVIDGVNHEWAAFSSLSNATGSFVSGPEASRSATFAMGILNDLQDGSLPINGEQLSIDSHRLYITGHSMGGLGTWDFIQRNPTYFAAAVPMTGYQDHDKADLLTEMPIWAFHHVDDTSNPYEGTETMVGLIQAAGSTVVNFTSYDSSNYSQSHPHNNLNAQAWNDEPGLYEWIFGQVNSRN